jgi:hypothetical protein
MSTPADELRTAAKLLRELAEAATPGNWWAEELPPNKHHNHPAHWVKTEYEDGDNCLTSQVVADCPWKQADAAFIAAMHPGVGAALADWLESAAKHDADGFLCCEHGPDACSEVVAPALAVARLINARP